jgi:hypothetical protein
MSRPSLTQTRPARTCGASPNTVADLHTKRNPDQQCPWDCARLGYMSGLLDSAGESRAAWCAVCDRAFTVTDWTKIPTPRGS